MTAHTLIIDNHDSFTFNLFQLVAVVNGRAPIVVRNGARWSELARLDIDNIVISPGPGRPERGRDFGVSADAIRRARVPVLGVCLGHQGLGHAFGGRVARASRVMHGRSSAVRHTGAGLFEGVPQEFAAVRYHSLALEDLPEELEVIAWTGDGIVMGVRHRSRPLWGVQFHPESIGTEHGARLLENFRDLTPRRPRELAPAGRRIASVVPSGRTAPNGPEELAVSWRRLEVWVDPERAFTSLYADSAASFWLDSSRTDPDLSRFSFMGDDAGPLAARVSYRVGGELAVEGGGAPALRPQGQTVLEFLREELRRRRVRAPDVPFDFHGGFVGYLGYEVKADCDVGRARPAALPDAYLLFADRVLAFDHLERAVYLVAVVPAADRHLADGWLSATGARLRDLAHAGAGGAAEMLAPSPATGAPEIDLAWSRDRARYLGDIRQCMDAIAAGESYEICLTNELRIRADVNGLELHRILRRNSPAPYAALLRLPGADVVCSSPERFLTVNRDRWAESRPIKGTSSRGRGRAEDERLKRALLAAEKDRAENLMIVDLLRNDLGVVCERGSVHVPRLMAVESYATVHQLVSTVRGRLREDVDVLDCLRQAFPGGSMTGAPKRRAVEILDRLEPEARGIYSGTLGFFSASGPVDLNIVIRTAVVTPGQVAVGVGGAITALSDPDAEWDEIRLKGRSLVDAVKSALAAGARPPSG